MKEPTVPEQAILDDDERPDWYELAEQGVSEAECAEFGFPLRTRRERRERET